ncbi:MAG: hypothetical protein KF850_33295 [Labilithrix sp.]|nr:hypothetical protein [Labilithrix sp.]
MLRPIGVLRLGLVVLAAAVVRAAVGCGPSPCTPEEFDLGGATRVTPRDLPGLAATSAACKNPRVDVVSSDDELRRLYDDMTVEAEAAVDAGESVSPPPTDLPVVDFTRERVIVREGPAHEGISWVVAQRETAVLGLLSCMGLAIPSCVVNVIAVPAQVSSVETRKCDAVACGGLQAPLPPTKMQQ